MPSARRIGSAVAMTLTASLLGLIVATALCLHTTPNLVLGAGTTTHAKLVARDHSTLTTTYRNAWNVHDQVALEDISTLLINAVLSAEDRRFYQHSGIDWRARLHAVWQNISARKTLRGASTISEQVVRMLHPRRRTVWARWMEGFEAQRMENQVSKNDILAFYLNQVPYASNRRGIAQAARHYFNRSVQTLNAKEALALAVLIRAPSSFDLWSNPGRAESRIQRLADAMFERNQLSARQRQLVANAVLTPQRPSVDTQARHFSRHVLALPPTRAAAVIETTLSPELQNVLQAVLDRRIEQLGHRNVRNGAALLVDHASNEILAWTVGGARSEATPGREIDAVTTPRQPGSTLKPFVYALALVKGWNAATVITDEPIAQAVGNGLHRYQNYSRTHYGPVTLRDALGNSLNIPAVKALQFVGVDKFLDHARELGIRNLNRHPTEYGDGLALGNGEVSLYELVQAYTVLAKGGRFVALQALKNQPRHTNKVVYDAKVASLLSDILSDSNARLLEFGANSVLNFSHQTAIKTGTSSDHTDSWAIGFDDRYTLGVWLGNLDRSPMHKVTGASGPAYVVRSIFSHLARNRTPRALYLSPQLVRRTVCVPQHDSPPCQPRSEWFDPDKNHSTNVNETTKPVFIRYPSDGLKLALDPRIPDEVERFRFELNTPGFARVTWFVDGEAVDTASETYLWSPSRGTHEVRATAWSHNNAHVITTPSVGFTVH